ncbi:MAG TPA: rhomboid family intramembrane serine protease, partial [Kofleriaceae bacterium]
VVLAIGSGAAEFAFSAGGIGLSGVVYGLAGCLFVLARVDRRFRDAIDSRTLILFGVWFVLCVVLTLTDVWNIGNVAHGSGFVLGMGIGFVIAPGARVRRVAAAGALLVSIAAVIGGAALWRPQLNLSSHAAIDDAYRGWHALGEQRYELAARHLERAIALDPNDHGTWFNYGVALQHTPGSRGITSIEAWERAMVLEPSDPKVRAILEERGQLGIQRGENSN